MSKRNSSQKSINLVLAGLAALPLFANNIKAEKPNIIFIVADDLGWSDLKCYGADLHETPNIDRLA